MSCGGISLPAWAYTTKGQIGLGVGFTALAIVITSSVLLGLYFGGNQHVVDFFEKTVRNYFEENKTVIYATAIGNGIGFALGGVVVAIEMASKKRKREAGHES